MLNILHQMKIDSKIRDQHQSTYRGWETKGKTKFLSLEELENLVTIPN